MTTYSGKEWVQACQFHSLSDAEVMAKITDRVRDHIASGSDSPALVLLDVDSSLYCVSGRHFELLRRWLETETDKKLEEMRANLSLDDFFYTPEDVFAKYQVPEFWEKFEPSWREGFFSNDFLHYDRIYEGALEFVKTLEHIGAVIVYLTGRDEPSMGEGTRIQFQRDGLPVESEQVCFHLKPARAGDDHAYKMEEIRKILKKGTVIASLENEPRNVVGIADQIPSAMNVFRDTVYSQHPAEARDQLYRLASFL